MSFGWIWYGRLRRCVLVTSFALAVHSCAAAATIDIDSVPAYGSTSAFLQGHVAGVDFSSYKVATTIFVPGLGYYTKPTFASPTVSIDSNGNFIAQVANGGEDQVATMFVADLLPPGVSPDIVGNSGSNGTIPQNAQRLARDITFRFGRTIDFSGYQWVVKDSPLPAGPGPDPSHGNRFSARPEDVYVDSGGNLHETITQRDGNYYSTEVYLSSMGLGYGTYSIQTNSRFDTQDANATFGAFTYDDFGEGSGFPGSPYRELDLVEHSRFGNSNEPTTSQHVVQPYTISGNIDRFTLPDLSGSAALTQTMTWLPGEVRFVTARGHLSPDSIPGSEIIEQHTYVDNPSFNHYVPIPGRESFHINLWLNQAAPAGSLPIQAVVNNFTFSPLGDYNRDGSVDAADYVVWRKTFGSSSDLRADGNNNGVIDTADYNYLRLNFGASDHRTIASGNSLAVAEPAAALLVLCGLPIAFLRSSR